MAFPAADPDSRHTSSFGSDRCSRTYQLQRPRHMGIEIFPRDGDPSNNSLEAGVKSRRPLASLKYINGQDYRPVNGCSPASQPASINQRKQSTITTLHSPNHLHHEVLKLSPLCLCGSRRPGDAAQTAGGLLSPISGGSSSSSAQTPSTSQVPILPGAGTAPVLPGSETVPVLPGTGTVPVIPSTTSGSATAGSDDQTVVGTVLNSIRILEASTQTNLKEIERVVACAKGNVDAVIEVQLKATLKANYIAIIKSIQTASSAITIVTTGAAGGVANQVKGLTQAEVNQLTDAVNSAKRDFIAAEVESLKGVLEPFFTPLLTFVSAVKKAEATVALTVTGLSTAQAELSIACKKLVSFLGLPQLPILNGLQPIWN